jgi:dihydropyrimidinase
MAPFDLVIRGGTVATLGMHAVADVGIAAGTIAAIGAGLRGAQEIDAAGKLVLPGGVDAHVHLSLPPGKPAEPAWVDDFTSGSAAALAGGITTVGNMTFPGPDEPPRAALAREEAVARTQCIADVFLHPVLETVTPQALEEIPGLLEAGCSSLKIFMVSPGFDAQIQDYVQAIRLAEASGLLTLLHCEDHALIQDATAHLLRSGGTTPRPAPSSPRSSPCSAPWPLPRRRAPPATSSTSPRPAPSPSVPRHRRAACPSPWKRARSTCT